MFPPKQLLGAATLLRWVEREATTNALIFDRVPHGLTHGISPHCVSNDPFCSRATAFHCSGLGRSSNPFSMTAGHGLSSRQALRWAFRRMVGFVREAWDAIFADALGLVAGGLYSKRVFNDHLTCPFCFLAVFWFVTGFFTMCSWTWVTL